MAKQILLRRNVVETLETGLVTTNSGTNLALIPAEAIGARVALQSIATGAPASYSIPILASLDGVNFATVAFATLTNAADLTVLPVTGVAAIKVGTITITGGTSPTASVLIRTQ